MAGESLDIFIYEEKFMLNKIMLEKLLKAFHCVITINFLWLTWKLLKNHLDYFENEVFKHFFLEFIKSFFKTFLNTFFHNIQGWIASDIKIMKIKILRWNVKIIYKKNRILQVKNRLLILEKDFKELRDLKEREIEEVFFESVIFSIVDINKFKEKDEEKVTACKKTWCNWLINYISETMKNNWWWERQNYESF